MFTSDFVADAPYPKSKYLEKQFNDAQAQLRDIVSDALDFDSVVLILPKFHHSPRQ